MFENIMKIFKKINKKSEKESTNSKESAKERLHLVLMQDRANVSADFLELMKQEIIEVIKKYIDVDETAIDVKLTNQENEDGTNGAPALYANIPIINIKNEARKVETKQEEQENITIKEDKKEESIQEQKETEKEEKNEETKIIIADEETNKQEETKEEQQEEQQDQTKQIQENTEEELKSEN